MRILPGSNPAIRIGPQIVIGARCSRRVPIKALHSPPCGPDLDMGTNLVVDTASTTDKIPPVVVVHCIQQGERSHLVLRVGRDRGQRRLSIRGNQQQALGAHCTPRFLVETLTRPHTFPGTLEPRQRIHIPDILEPHKETLSLRHEEQERAAKT